MRKILLTDEQRKDRIENYRKYQREYQRILRMDPKYRERCRKYYFEHTKPRLIMRKEND